MKEASRFWRWHGYKRDIVKAIKIKIHAHARKKGPFVDEKDKPVYWVNWSKPTGPKNKRKRPYFRHYPTHKNTVSKKVEKDVENELSELTSVQNV